MLKDKCFIASIYIFVLEKTSTTRSPVVTPPQKHVQSTSVTITPGSKTAIIVGSVIAAIVIFLFAASLFEESEWLAFISMIIF